MSRWLEVRIKGFRIQWKKTSLPMDQPTVGDVTDAGGKRRHKPEVRTPPEKPDRKATKKFHRCFQRSWMWLSDSSGWTFPGGMVLERDFLFVLVFGGAEVGVGESVVMMTDIPYIIAVWCFFFGKQPKSILTSPRFVQERKWSTFQIAGFTECCSHETKFGNKAQPSRRRFSTKKVGQHLFRNDFFFACVFSDKNLKFWKVARFGPRFSRCRCLVWVWRLEIPRFHGQVGRTTKPVRHLGHPKELLK